MCSWTPFLVAKIDHCMERGLRVVIYIVELLELRLLLSTMTSGISDVMEGNEGGLFAFTKDVLLHGIVTMLSACSGW